MQSGSESSSVDNGPAWNLRCTPKYIRGSRWGHGGPRTPGSGIWLYRQLCCAVLCLVAQSCLTLCNPVARLLQWVAIPFSRGSSQSRDQTQVSHIAGGFFTSWATREAQEYWSGLPCPPPGDLPDPWVRQPRVVNCFKQISPTQSGVFETWIWWNYKVRIELEEEAEVGANLDA